MQHIEREKGRSFFLINNFIFLVALLACSCLTLSEQYFEDTTLVTQIKKQPEAGKQEKKMSFRLRVKEDTTRRKLNQIVNLPPLRMLYKTHSVVVP